MGTSAATSTITVNPLNGFNGAVALSDTPLPQELDCQAFSRPTVAGSGQSQLSCTSTTPGSYPVTITGTSGALVRPTIATFRFSSTNSLDFTVSAASPVSFTAGSAAISTVTVKALHGFYSQVSLSTSVLPSTGLSVSLNTQSFIYCSGTSTATFTSSTHGTYTVTITGTYGSLIRPATIQVTVTSATTPDVTVTPSVSSLSFNRGTSGTATITVDPKNGFTGTVSLSTSQSSPAGLTRTLPTSVTIGTSPQTVALTCNISSAGDYTITITTRAGANTHTTTMPVHVAGVSPAAPAPATIPGLDQTIFYAIIAGIIVIVVAGTVISIRQRGSKS